MGGWAACLDKTVSICDTERNIKKNTHWKKNELQAVTALMSSISASRSSKGAGTAGRKEALRQAARRATEAWTQVTFSNEATGEGY